LTVFSPLFTLNAPHNAASASEILPKEINDLLSDYSLTLASGKSNHPTYYSSEMETLVADRRNYYRDFFEKGLHSNLIGLSSEFKVESAVISQSGNVYKVNIIEDVKMIGKPIVTLPADYPLIQAANWAISQTNNEKVESYLEQYIASMTKGIEESVKKDVEIVSLIRHEIELVKEKEFTKITRDAFSDQSTDNQEGFDSVIWTENEFMRLNLAWQKMPDYEMYNLPVETIGYRLLKDYEAVVGASLMTTTFSGNNFPTNRGAAVWYIQEYTSNPQYWQYISCSPYPSVLQDTDYYNPEYSSIWENIGCNDCTDYVSQALNYGGFPEDSSWQADLYNIYWIRPYRLSQYFDTTINRGDFVSNLASLQVGDLAFIYNYDYVDEDLNWKHVVMVSEINPHRYSGHTNDRFNYPFSSDFNRFMVVNYYPKPIYLPLVMKDGSYLSRQSLNPYPAPNENSNLSPYPAP
jgi:hypothetical protein